MRRAFVPSVEEAAERAVVLGETCDVYAGVATRRGRIGTREGVGRMWAIWSDLDAKGGHTRESRLEQLRALPCPPSIVVSTGGGLHIYHLLRRPAESSDEMHHAELVMKRMSIGLDSDPVYDRSRIMRVPATYNRKRGEPRPVELELFEPARRYNLDQLQEMAVSLPGAVDGSHASVGGKVPREVLGEPIREYRRNVSLTSVAGSLRDRGLDVETIGVVLLGANRARCEPPLPEPEVLAIARSIGRYPAGERRYRPSPVRRVDNNSKER